MLLAPDSIRVAPHWALAAIAPNKNNETLTEQKHSISSKVYVFVGGLVLRLPLLFSHEGGWWYAPPL